MSDSSVKTHNIRNMLIDFINTHPNWKEDLKKPPYNLKAIRNNGENKNWYLFNYRHFFKGYTTDIAVVTRGIVLEVINNKVTRVISHAFDNFEQYAPRNDGYIDWSNCELLEKMDGQLIKCSKVDGQIYWFAKEDLTLEKECDLKTDEFKTTKDVLDFALYGKDKKKPEWFDNVPEGWTIFFELTCPYTTLICHFKETKLWLLGARDVEGYERKPEQVKEMFKIGYDIPRKFEAKDVKSIQEIIDQFDGKDFEGVVITEKSLRKGEFSIRRLKLKGQGYLKIKFNRIKNITDRDIYVAVLNEDIDDLLGHHPEIKERTDIIMKNIDNLNTKIENNILKAHEKYNELGNDMNKFEKYLEESKLDKYWITYLKHQTFESWEKENKIYSYENFLTLCKMEGIETQRK